MNKNVRRQFIEYNRTKFNKTIVERVNGLENAAPQRPVSRFIVRGSLTLNRTRTGILMQLRLCTDHSDYKRIDVHIGSIHYSTLRTLLYFSELKKNEEAKGLAIIPGRIMRMRALLPKEDPRAQRPQALSDLHTDQK